MAPDAIGLEAQWTQVQRCGNQPQSATPDKNIG
jgi:hypothetical protein